MVRSDQRKRCTSSHLVPRKPHQVLAPGFWFHPLGSASGSTLDGQFIFSRGSWSCQTASHHPVKDAEPVWRCFCYLVCGVWWPRRVPSVFNDPKWPRWWPLYNRLVIGSWTEESAPIFPEAASKVLRGLGTNGSHDRLDCHQAQRRSADFRSELETWEFCCCYSGVIIRQIISIPL